MFFPVPRPTRVPCLPVQSSRPRNPLPASIEALERRTLFAVATVNLISVKNAGYEQGPEDALLAVTRSGGDLSVPLPVAIRATSRNATRGADYEIADSVTIPGGATF